MTGDSGRLQRLDRLFQWYGNTGHQKAGWLVERVQPVCTGDLILAEVLQGFRQDADYQTAKSLLCALPIHAMAGTEISLKSAENFRALRKQGITIRLTIDTLIATYCIETGLTLLHSNKDFQPFQQYLGLQTV